MIKTNSVLQVSGRNMLENAYGITSKSKFSTHFVQIPYHLHPALSNSLVVSMSPGIPLIRMLLERSRSLVFTSNGTKLFPAGSGSEIKEEEERHSLPASSGSAISSGSAQGSPQGCPQGSPQGSLGNLGMIK